MNRKILWTVALIALVAVPGMAQRTPKSLADNYSALADAILALNQAEHFMVRNILERHQRMAEIAFNQGKYDQAAAEIALFANEGDNAIGGIRKRLIEGGHHHNAAGEEKGIYDPGFVIVTRKAKKRAMDAAAALRQAPGQPAREEAWSAFQAVAQSLLGSG